MFYRYFCFRVSLPSQLSFLLLPRFLGEITIITFVSTFPKQVSYHYFCFQVSMASQLPQVSLATITYVSTVPSLVSNFTPKPKGKISPELSYCTFSTVQREIKVVKATREVEKTYISYNERIVNNYLVHSSKTFNIQIVRNSSFILYFSDLDLDSTHDSTLTRVYCDQPSLIDAK